MRVLVVEDDIGVLRSLARWFRLHTDSEIIECSTVAQARGVRPSLAAAIVDWRLPDGDGLELVGELRATSPDVEALVVTASTSSEVVNRAHLLGASVVRKPCLEGNLRELVRRVGARPPRPPPGWTVERAVDHLAASLGLTPQQQRIVALRAHGVRRAELADALQLAESTVRSHVREIVTRAGVENLDQLAWLLFELAASTEGERS
jgi:DNA-binding NarL/FixJ family response regulator